MDNIQPEQLPKRMSWVKKVLWAVFALAAVLTVTVLALRVFITTDAGHRFIQDKLNAQSIGPLERIEITGLSGDPLRDFKIEGIRVFDKDGVWLTLEDISLKWSPSLLLSRHIKIDDIDIGTALLLRRPVLNTRPAQEPSNKPAPKITAPQIDIASLRLEEGVAGQAASFELDAGVRFTQDLKSLKLNLMRIDAAGDNLRLDVVQGMTKDITGEFSLSGVAGGPIATLLRAPPEVDVSGQGEIYGTIDQGKGDVQISFGEASAILASASWTPDSINASVAASPAAWPSFEALQSQLGSEINVNAKLTRKSEPREFEGQLVAQYIVAAAKGVLPNKGFRPQAADVSLTIANPSRLAALPEGYTVGAFTAEGRVNLSDDASFDGLVSIADVASPYGKAQSVSGPITLKKGKTDRASFGLDLEGQGIDVSIESPVALSETARVKSAGFYDVETRVLTLSSTSLISGDASVTAAGRVDFAEFAYDLDGDLKLSLIAQGAVPSGQLAADYNVVKSAQNPPALTSSGTFIAAKLPPPLDVLLGARTAFETKMQPVDGGIRIDLARISGANLEAALEGIITDKVDISAEARTRERFVFNAVEFGNAANITAQISGTRDAPSVRLQADAAELTVSGQTLSDLKLKAEIIDILKNPKGPIELTAVTDYGPFSAAARLASAEEIIRATDIQLTLADVTASGEMSYLSSGFFDGRLGLNLPKEGERFARADLILKPAAGDVQGVSFNAEARKIAYQDFEFDSFTAEATGTFESLSGNVNAKGQRNVGALSYPVVMTSPFKLSQSELTGIVLQATPKGQYSNLDVMSRGDVRLILQDGKVDLILPLSIQDQPLDVTYARPNEGEERFKLKSAALPISLFPLPGNFADSNGTWAADIDLTAQSGVPSGTLSLDINDWRGFGADVNTGLNAGLTANIAASAAQFKLTGQSLAGFNLSGNLGVPLLPADSLLGLRPNMDAAVTGEFKASGAAETVLGLFAPATAELDGELDMDVRIGGTLATPRVEGRASGQALNFEAEQLGTQIKNGRFTARFNNETLSVTDVYFSDARDGFAQGQGEFVLGEFGRPLGQVTVSTQKFYIVDRRDVSARVSGRVKYESLAKSAKISGEVTVGEAEIKQLVAAGVSVIEIQVEEINAPSRRQSNQSQAPILPTFLDVSVKAPRRVFVRSRGLDVELSADIKIGGTIEEPTITGRAEVERGGYKIAGKTLAFESGSVIFDGPVMNARVALVAVAETTNLTASVKIGGTIAEPEIELSSSPDRPDDEILSALLFGRSATELSAIEAAQLAGALAQFSGDGVGFNLLGGLRDSLGIGQLSVGVSEDGSAQITGGRYLARNVYLQVFSGVDASQAGAIIDWELRRNISLRSRIDADSEQSLSLRYKKDF